MATIEQLAGDTGEGRIPYNVAPPLMQSPVTPQERRYENIASDILSLMSQTGAAVEATAKLGDVATKRLAIDNLKSFEKARSKIIHEYTISKDGKTILPNEVDYQGMTDALNTMNEQYRERFDTQRQQDIYDSLYTNPADKLMLNTTDKINEMQHDKDMEKLATDIENNSHDKVLVLTKEGSLDTYNRAMQFGAPFAGKIMNNMVTTIADVFSGIIDDPKQFEELNKKYKFIDINTGDLQMQNLIRAFVDIAPDIITFDKKTLNLVAAADFKDKIPNRTLNDLNTSIAQIGRNIAKMQASALEKQQEKIAKINEDANNGKSSVSTLDEFYALEAIWNQLKNKKSSSDFEKLPQVQKDAINAEFSALTQTYTAHRSVIAHLESAMNRNASTIEIGKIIGNNYYYGETMIPSNKLQALYTSIVSSKVEAIDNRASQIYSKKSLNSKDYIDIEALGRESGKYSSYADITNSKGTYLEIVQNKMKNGNFGSLQEALFYTYRAQEMIMRNPNKGNADIYSQMNYTTHMINGIKKILNSNNIPKTPDAVAIDIYDLNSAYLDKATTSDGINKKTMIEYVQNNENVHIGNITATAQVLSNKGVVLTSMDNGIDQGHITVVNYGSTVGIGGTDSVILSIPDGNGNNISGSSVKATLQKLLYARYLPEVGSKDAALRLSKSDLIIETLPGADGSDASLRIKVIFMSSGNSTVFTYQDIQKAYKQLDRQERNTIPLPRPMPMPTRDIGIAKGGMF